MTDEKFALLIEDDSDLINIFSMALEDAGFIVETISEGDVALKRLQELTLTPGVVILDLHLPHLPGTEILKAIREDEGLKSTKVIIVSADPGLADTTKDDADLVLIKPVSYKQLSALARRLAS